MAARRIFLGAEDCRSSITREHDELLDPDHEVRRRRAARIVDGSVVPVELTLGAAPERVTQEDVVDGMRGEQLR